MLFKECGEDSSHLISVVASWIDDRGDTGNHGAVEHRELACYGKDVILWYFALEVLSDLEVELGRLKAGNPGRVIAVARQAAEEPWALGLVRSAMSLREG